MVSWFNQWLHLSKVEGSGPFVPLGMSTEGTAKETCFLLCGGFVVCFWFVVLGGLWDFSCLTREHGPQQWKSQILTTSPPRNSLSQSVCTHVIFPPFSHFAIFNLLCYISSTSVKVVSLFYIYVYMQRPLVCFYPTVFILVFTPYCSLIFCIERGVIWFFFGRVAQVLYFS